MRGEIDVIEWGLKILKYLDEGRATELEKEKLSWVLNYRSLLAVYQEIAICFDIVTQEVRENGYYPGLKETLKRKCEPTLYSERGQYFFSKLLAKANEEAIKVPAGQRLPGCSEVIESVFGKYKQLEKNHASAGLTSLVLGLPALVGNITMDTVKAAMEQVSVERVKNWVLENLGKTFWSRRRKDLHGNILSLQDYLEKDDFHRGILG